MASSIFNQLDQVEITSIARVKYLSAQPGSSPNPQGIWTVVGIIEGDLVLNKGDALIRLPMMDARKVSEYSKQSIIDKLGEICRVKKASKEQ